MQQLAINNEGRLLTDILSLPDTSKMLWTYRQNEDTSSYLYQKDLPEMTEMTFCFWFTGLQPEDDSRRNPCIVSIASSGIIFQ